MRTAKQRVTMADRPPAPLPHEQRPTSKSRITQASLSGSYDEPRQWMAPVHQQCKVGSLKAASTVNEQKKVDGQMHVSADNVGANVKIPAVPRSTPPSAADYAQLTTSSKPSDGYIAVRAATAPPPDGQVNSETSSKETDKRRCQTLALTKGKKSNVSLGISWAHGVADAGKGEGSAFSNGSNKMQFACDAVMFSMLPACLYADKQTGGSSKSGADSATTTSGGRSPRSKSPDSSLNCECTDGDLYCEVCMVANSLLLCVHGCFCRLCLFSAKPVA